MATIGTVTYPTDSTWEVEIADLAVGSNAFVISDGVETLDVDIVIAESNVTDSTGETDSAVARLRVNVVDSTTQSDSAMRVVPCVDSTSSTDSNVVQITSPAAVAVTDSAHFSDSNSCLLTRTASVVTPFLLAASFLMAVLFDTATADEGTAASDSTAISLRVPASDGTSSVEEVLAALTCRQDDGTTQTDSANAILGGIVASADDATTSSDEVACLLTFACDVADVTASSDSTGVEQIFPATVNVLDETTSTDLVRVTAAVGQVDSTISSDEAVAVVGLLVTAQDETTSDETQSISITTIPPPVERPPACVAIPVPVGVLATPRAVGQLADPVRAGVQVLRRSATVTGTCYQGCDFPIFFPQILDATGARIPLTGANLECSARINGNDYPASATSLDAAAGTGEAIFNAARTNGWTPGTKGQFDAIVRFADGTTYLIGKGTFVVADPITPTP